MCNRVTCYMEIGLYLSDNTPKDVKALSKPFFKRLSLCYQLGMKRQ